MEGRKESVQSATLQIRCKPTPQTDRHFIPIRRATNPVRKQNTSSSTRLHSCTAWLLLLVVNDALRCKRGKGISLA